MKKGILKTILFYAVGLTATALTYLTFGPGSGHGPGVYVLIPFVTLLIGLFWTVSTIFNYLFKNKTDERKGVILSHATVFIVVLGIVLYSRSQSELSNVTDIEDEIVASNNNDTTLVMYNGKAIYLKVKDSVHFDKRDSLAAMSR